MDATIIVVNYNTRELILDCLASISKHAAGFSFEIIVVDNASSDGSAEAIEKEFPDVRVYCNTQNVGFAGGVKQGVGRSNGEFIILFNSDAYLVDDAFQAMIAYAQQTTKVGAVGCRVMNADGSHQPTAGRFPNLWLDFSDHFLRPLRFLPLRWRRNCVHSDDYQHAVDVDWLAGSCVLLRRKAIEEASGIDESFFLGDEDIDLGYRLKKCGWRVVYFPLASVIHLGGQSKKMNPRSAQYFFMGRYRFYQKHYSKSYARLFRGLLLIAYGGRWLAARTSAGIKKQRSAPSMALYEQYWKNIRRW